MANFKTHLNVAIISSGLAAGTLLSATHINFNCALWLWFLGTIGGLLPDIDSDNSTSLDTIFAMFTLTAVLLTIRYLTGEVFKDIRFMTLIAASLTVYGIMRYLIRPLFEKVTIHRGSCHSIAFLLLSSFCTIQLTWKLSYNYTQQPDIIAWLSGGFIFLGGIVHLLLDEIYSVDLLNVRIKRSFGTAIKLADFNNKSLTLLLFIAIIGLAYISPSSENTIDTLTNWSKFKL
ncbi:MAG: metal-dependent hydrolase [Psychromonas sp.]|nr:metal-dependent hydrolase [Psychromonas sp.]